ncbi:MAG: molybdopterin molybdotransferase MoeA [Ignavibacteriales bacterium]|nr:molybdopterin molybdotransferase MoeA [Ignavibacteriales bacterium]
MISYADALRIVCSHGASLSLRTETLTLLQTSGRILAENVVADTDLPPFDNSTVDGYAVRLQPGTTEWKIIATSHAGHSAGFKLNEESAVAIMTGASLPDGADAIIPIEDVLVDSDRIRLRDDAAILRGKNIRRKGEDLKCNSLAVPGFSFIKPQTVSLLAACGCHHPLVFQKLRAGILSSGDELIPIESTPRDDKIRATNPSMLISSAESMQLIPVDLGVVADSKEQLRATIGNALEEQNLDLLITTGGVSVGAHDYVKEVLESVGMRTIFWRVKIRPGKPVLFGMLQKGEKAIPVFGLPGNPVSAFVGFSLFVKPFLETVYHQHALPQLRASLENPISKKDTMRHFMRGVIRYDAVSGKNCAAVLAARSSGDMKTLSDANCLVIVPESVQSLPAGAEVECIPI